MSIQRKYAGLNWVGEKQFYGRFLQLERLGFRRYRTLRVPQNDPRFFIVLPTDWTFETKPVPPQPDDPEIPPPSVRYVIVRDEHSRKRVTLVEQGEDTNHTRLLVDIWLDTYYYHSFPEDVLNEYWLIKDAYDNVKQRIPFKAPDAAGRNVLDLAEEWLDLHFPDWRDPFAYWDD